MSEIGRVLVDGNGIILTADRAFAALMRGPACDMIGLSALTITAPADRQKSAELFIRLRDGGAAIRTTKRLMRRDGSHLWVHTRADRAIAESARDGAPRFMILVEPTTTPGEWVEPAHLLQLAEMVALGRRTRAAVFSPTLFGDQAWDILLRAYIAEAHGKSLTDADLDGRTGYGRVNVRRWLRALETEGLIDVEDRTTSDATAIRLSTCGHARFERYLTDLFAKLTAMVPQPAT